jgi:hypothetical protein
LHGVLKIDQLLIQLAEAGLDFLEIIGESLDLRGHGVQTRTGIGGNVLHGFLQGAHGAVELGHGLARLLDEGLHDSMVLGHLGGDISLPLQQGSDVLLKLDNFAGHGFGRARTGEAAADGPGQDSGAKNGDVA